MIISKFYDSLCEDARKIREEVFVREQGFENEFDELENTAIHLVLYEGEQAAATGRLVKLSEEGCFLAGRIAVLPQYRKLHLGSQILELLECKAKSLGGKKMEVSAQCRVQAFYERNGYQAGGPVYLDEFCQHIHMEKVL